MDRRMDGWVGERDGRTDGWVGGWVDGPHRALCPPPPCRNPTQVHLRRAVHCDLFVDSRLCNAHTSATDALWAGTSLPRRLSIGLPPPIHRAAASVT